MPTIDPKHETYGAVGDGVTDDADALIAAIAALGTGDTLAFPAGTYLTSKALPCISKTNVTISGTSATIKLKDEFNGYSVDGYYGLHFKDCSGVTISNMTFDGNKAGDPVPAEGISCVVINNCTNTTISGCTFKNSDYHALWIRTSSAGSVVDTCAFTDNCDATGNDSDIYVSSAGAFQVSNCTFTRTRATNHQAIYAASGPGTFVDNEFTGPATAYDLRAGTHTINGSTGTVGCALILQGTDTALLVTAKDMVFECDADTDITGSLTEGVYVSTGTLHLSDSQFTAIAGDNNIGLRIFSSDAKAFVRQCTFNDFALIGAYVTYTAGGSVLYRNTFKLAADKTGLYSGNNTGVWHAVGNTFTTVNLQLNNADSKCHKDRRWWNWRKRHMKLR